MLRSIRASSAPTEQRAIAHILGTLDDKIELNRRMNATLEAMARALFKSWFVDFDPVRAKTEGRDTGLPREIADLFPDAFEESEVGEMPIGWQGCRPTRATRSSETQRVECRSAPPDLAPCLLTGKQPTGVRSPTETNSSFWVRSALQER